MALLMSLGVTGCATTTQVNYEPAFCDNAYPIYISRQDVLSDTTAREILEHNKTGQKLCDWKPLTSKK